MSIAVDRNRVIRFLDSIDTDGATADSVGTGVYIRGSGRQRRQRRTSEHELDAAQLRRVYREVLSKGRGKLVHRYERLVGDLSCLCYQNSHAPRVGFCFFHGLDGSPYDFLYTVRRFFDRLGDRVPAVWVLPAGVRRSRSASTLVADQTDVMPKSPPALTSPSAHLIEPSPTDVAQAYVDSPFGPNPSVCRDGLDRALRRRVEEFTAQDISCPDIDPSGGYQWWEIPVLDLISSRPKTLKGFLSALKQNLRTPKAFFQVRETVVRALTQMSTLWSIPMSQIYVGGFSQGAMLASDILLAAPSALAGAVLLSGAPVGRSDHRQAMRECRISRSQNAAVAMAAADDVVSHPSAHLPVEAFSSARFTVPVFQAHGIRDPVVPFPIGKWLKRHLHSMGFVNVTFESFNGGHDFPFEIGERMFTWLLTTPAVRALAFRRPLLNTPDNEGARLAHSSHFRSRLSRLRRQLPSFRRRRAVVSAVTQEVTSLGNVVSSTTWQGSPMKVMTEIEIDDESDEEESGLNWSEFTVAATREIVEMCLSVSNLEAACILPPLDEVKMLATTTDVERRELRRGSVLDCEDIQDEDWTALNRRIDHALQTPATRLKTIRGDMDFPKIRKPADHTPSTCVGSPCDRSMDSLESLNSWCGRKASPQPETAPWHASMVPKSVRQKKSVKERILLLLKKPSRRNRSSSQHIETSLSESPSLYNSQVSLEFESRPRGSTSMLPAGRSLSFRRSRSLKKL